MCERLGAYGIVDPSHSQNTNNFSSLPAHGLGELRRLDPLPKTLCSAQQAKLCTAPNKTPGRRTEEIPLFLRYLGTWQA